MKKLGLQAEKQPTRNLATILTWTTELPGPAFGVPERGGERELTEYTPTGANRAPFLV